MRWRQVVRIAGIAAAIGFPAGHAEGQATPGVSPGFALEPGQSVLFLGDSITHQWPYTQYVEDFFYTRYPEKKLRFHNAGVSGDKAGDAILRFEKDVAVFKPTLVTVLLGMNDGAYEDFDSGTFELYAEGMETLLRKIGEIGARPVVMSPTMFDHHQLGIQRGNPEFRFRERQFSDRYNAVLAYYGAWLRERSGREGLAYVDQWSPMNQKVFWRRRTEADFTVVPDAIHPAPAGQFLMAFELIDQSRPVHRDVSNIHITLVERRYRIAKGSDRIEQMTATKSRDRVSFSHTARSLPWVVPDAAYGVEMAKWDAEPAAPIGVKMVPSPRRLASERFRFIGLALGNYDLVIDGQRIRTYRDSSLAAGIELQDEVSSPQYRQALDVALLNRERNDVAVRPLRDAWGSLKGLRRKWENDAAAFEREAAPIYRRIDELNALAREYEDRIHAIAVPKPRRYELTRVAGS